jgi:hypothetical protein
MSGVEQLVINTGVNVTITLPPVAALKTYYFQNSGTGAMAIIPSDAALIAGDVSLVMSFTGSSCALVSTGTNFLIF